MRTCLLIQSYPQLKNIERYYSLAEFSTKRIVVIGNPHLFEYLTNYVGLKEVSFIHEVSYSYKRPWSIWRARYYCRHKLNFSYEVDAVYFSSYEFVGVSSVIINNLASKSVPLIHLADPGCDVYKSCKLHLKSFRDFWKYTIDIFVFGRVFEYAQFTPQLNRKYIRRLSSSLIDYANIKIEPVSRLAVLRDKKSPICFQYIEAFQSCKIVIVLKDIVGQGLITEQDYIKNWARIKKVLSKDFKDDEIWVKLKPGKRKPWDVGIFYGYRFIPDCLPFETVQLNNNVKVLGFTSTAMANSLKTTISLVDLFDLHDNENVLRSIKVMKSRSKKEVKYPENLKDLSRLLNES